MAKKVKKNNLQSWPRSILTGHLSRKITRRKKSRRPSRSSKNFWKNHDIDMSSPTTVHSKIELWDYEREWIEQNCPSAIIEFRRVPNYQSCPAYKAGVWDGFAYFVTLKYEILEDSDCQMFCKFMLSWGYSEARRHCKYPHNPISQAIRRKT